MMKRVRSTGKGFTIVELLIVIVVIAILAAVTTVAYQGVANSANNRSVQAYLSQLAKKIELAKVEGFQFMRYSSAETGALGKALKSVPVPSGIDTSREFPIIITHGGYYGDVMVDTTIRAYSKSGDILSAWPGPGGTRVDYESSKEMTLRTRQQTLETWQTMTYASCTDMYAPYDIACPWATETEFNAQKASTIQSLEQQIAEASGSQLKWPNLQLASCPTGNTTVDTNVARLGHGVTCYTYTDNGDYLSYAMAYQARIMYSSAQNKFVNVVMVAS